MRSAEQILWESRTIAVVGASRNATKTAHTVPLAIMRRGWRIIPVNPFADQIFGVPAYRTLADIPEPVDFVNVFRPSADATQVVKDAIAIGAPAVWLQQDIVSARGPRPGRGRRSRLCRGHLHRGNPGGARDQRTP